MKKFVYFLCLTALGIMPVLAQDQPKLTTFDLDFPGGTPAELVKSIEHAAGKPLNAIIPIEGADVQLPPLKMNNVVVPKLFAALGASSERYVAVSGGYGGFPNSYQQVETGYGFKTSDNPVTDASIWSFYVNKPNLPPVITTTAPVCEFFQLQSYLERGFTVDDITTAIQTGWKMADISPVPELNYHKETKLLIAFGKPEALQMIQSVLGSLPQSNASTTVIETLQGRVGSLEWEVSRLSKQVSALTANPTEKNSGK